MRESLPDLIHGNLEPAKLAQVEAHVASCDACAAELELLRAVVASMPPVPAIDVQRIVAGLPVAAKQGLLLHRGTGDAVAAPVATAKRSQSVWSRPILRVAAAAVIVAAGGLSLLVGRDVLNPHRQVAQNTRPVAVTSTPVAAQVSEPAITPDVTPLAESSSRAATTSGGGVGLLISEVQQLSDEHLVALLSEMESIDPLPAAEPETLEPAIAESDSGGSE
jgi:anti-sigma factor RsiW